MGQIDYKARAPDHGARDIGNRECLGHRGAGLDYVFTATEDDLKNRPEQVFGKVVSDVADLVGGHKAVAVSQRRWLFKKAGWDVRFIAAQDAEEARRIGASIHRLAFEQLGSFLRAVRKITKPDTTPVASALHSDASIRRASKVSVASRPLGAAKGEQFLLYYS